MNQEDLKMGQTLISAEGKIIQKGWTFYYGFATPVDANVSEFKLERDSPINHETITGIQVRRKGDNNALSINGNDLVNDDAFDASFLTLKQRNAEVFERIPLYNIHLATQQGTFYPVMIPLVDMYQSSIICSDSSLLVDGEDYELVVRYWNSIIQKK
jgi:hypothetical protein